MGKLWNELKECKNFHELKTVLGGRLKDAGCTSPMGVYRWMGVDRREKVLTFFLSMLVLMPVFAIVDVLKDMILYDRNMTPILVSELHGNMFRFNGAVIFLLVLYFLICRHKEHPVSLKERFTEYPWMFLLVALLIWSIICAGMAESPKLAIFGSKRFVEGIRTYFIYGSLIGAGFLVQSKKRRLFLARLFVHSAIPVMIILYLQVADVDFINEAFYYIRSSTFTHFNHLGYYQSLVIPCAAGLLLYDRSSVKRTVIYSIELLMLAYAQILCDTMGGYLGTLFGVMIVPFVFRIILKRKMSARDFLPATLFLLMTLLSVADVLPMGYQGSTSLRENFASLFTDVEMIAEEDENMEDAGTGRIRIWMTCLDYMQERPIFGYGPENMGGTELANAIGEGYQRPANEYLTWLIFDGVPGFALYLGFVLVFAITCFKNIRKLTDFGLLAGAVVVSYLISAFFGNSIFSTTSYFWIFVGFLGSAKCGKAVPSESEVDSDSESVSDIAVSEAGVLN